MATDPTDPRWFRNVLGQYPTGVSVITTTEADGTRAGFVVGTFTSISLNPPLVGFMPDKGSSSWPKIQAAGKFCVNILSEDQEDVSRVFASKADDKFAEIGWRRSGNGSPIIDGVLAYIDCDIAGVLDGGDHDIVVGAVNDLEVRHEGGPLVFFRGGYGRVTF